MGRGSGSVALGLSGSLAVATTDLVAVVALLVVAGTVVLGDSFTGSAFAASTFFSVLGAACFFLHLAGSKLIVETWGVRRLNRKQILFRMANTPLYYAHVYMPTKIKNSFVLDKKIMDTCTL